MSGAHNPHNPQPTYPHNPQMAPYYRSRKNYILLNLDIVREAHTHPSPFLFALVRLSSIFVQERKYTLSWEPRNE